MRPLTYIWICLAVIVTLSGFGISTSHALHELFQSIDQNEDGKISMQEFKEDMKEYVFNELDNNNNKVISRAEWMSIEGVSETKKHEELFQGIDKDKDKRISFIEFSDYAEKHSNIDTSFMGLDKDNSNNLAPDELAIRPLFKMITIKLK